MNLLRAASTVSTLTLASRITGLVRDQLIAGAFGAGAAADAFYVAFRIPNLFRRLFAEGAFSQAFVPLLAHTREAEGDQATRQLVDAVATVLWWVLVALCVVGVAAAPALVWLLAAGLEKFDLAAQMTRWMFPYIACMSLVALAAGILNTWRRFALPAATPVLLNLCVIVAAWLGVPWFERLGVEPVLALAAGVMLGGVLQLALQLPALHAVGMLPRLHGLQAAWSHPGLRRVLGLMAPALLGVSVAQISLLINTQIASHVAVGAVSWLYYADRLMEFPTALLGVALGVVLLPQLASARSRSDEQAYSALLDWGLRLVVLLALPCAVALIVFPLPLVATLFHYGAFGADDAHQTTLALMGYGAGLLGLVAVKVLAPGFFARQDTKTPVKVAIVVLLATQLMNAGLVPRLGHAGLALSIGVGALVNAGLLLAGLMRVGAYRPLPGWPGFAARVALASLVLGAGLHLGANAVDWLALQARWAERASWLALALALSALVYFGALAASGLDLRQFVRRG